MGFQCNAGFMSFKQLFMPVNSFRYDCFTSSFPLTRNSSPFTHFKTPPVTIFSYSRSKPGIRVKMERVIKTLIVDDEPVARQILREELSLMPDVDLIGEAGDGKEALRKIVDLQPDLVFLDLQMPQMGGFEVVRRLTGTHLPVIVVVTAFHEH